MAREKDMQLGLQLMDVDLWPPWPFIQSSTSVFLRNPW